MTKSTFDYDRKYIRLRQKVHSIMTKSTFDYDKNVHRL